MSIKLNAEKMHFRQKQGTYMGHMISSEGRGADPNKLKSINEMPPPTDKHGVQRILGIVNYVQLIFEPGDDEYVAEIDVKEQVNAAATLNKVFATLLVNGEEEKFQLDSGSTVNVMSDKTVCRLCGKTVLQCDASVSGLGASDCLRFQGPYSC